MKMIIVLALITLYYVIGSITIRIRERKVRRKSKDPDFAWDEILVGFESGKTKGSKWWVHEDRWHQRKRLKETKKK